MQLSRLPSRNVLSLYDSNAKKRATRRPDHNDEEKSGNGGPGKPMQISTSSSTAQSMKPSIPGPFSESQTISLDTALPSSIAMATSMINSVTITEICFDSPSTCIPTASLPSKPSNQQFVFNDLQNTTTCGTLDLTWTFSGQTRVPMTLIVQDQAAILNSGTTNAQPQSPMVFRTLTNNTPSDANGYVWSPVDINEGWYFAKAFNTGTIQGISAQSGLFFVSRGQDVKCLLSNATTTANPITPTSPPTNTISGREPLGTGDIIAISLGVTIGVTVLVLAYAFPRLWHRELPDPKNRRPYLLY